MASVPVDTEAAYVWKSKWVKLVNIRKYFADKDEFNIDETGLFYNCKPQTKQWHSKEKSIVEENIAKTGLLFW